jgi:hypothetical protein
MQKRNDDACEMRAMNLKISWSTGCEAVHFPMRIVRAIGAWGSEFEQRLEAADSRKTTQLKPKTTAVQTGSSAVYGAAAAASSDCRK